MAWRTEYDEKVRNLVSLNPGKRIYLDPTYGSDGGDGSINAPVKTLACAYSMGRTGRNDVIYMIPGSSTIALTGAVSWTRSNSGLIGLGSESPYSPCVITDDGVAGTITFGPPFISIVGNHNKFSNIRFLFGNTETANTNMMRIQGHGNIFENCMFDGPMSTELADLETFDLVKLGGFGNVFRNCIFGTMAKTRSFANNLLKFERMDSAVGCPGSIRAACHTIFENCIFQSNVDDISVTHIDVNSEGGGLYGAQYFRNCFLYFRWSDQVDQVTEAIRWGSAGLVGTLHFDANCSIWGADDVTVGTTARTGIIWAHSTVTAATLGLAQNTA